MWTGSSAGCGSPVLTNWGTGSCTRSCTPAQAMWLPTKEKHLWMKATVWSNGRRMLWLLLSSCPCRKSKEVFTVCVQAGAMSSWLRKWLRSSKSPSRPCVFGWKHAISYKFGTARPLLLREGRSRSAVRRLCCMHFVRSLANKEGGEWHEERKRHCAEMQKTDGDPWI